MIKIILVQEENEYQNENDNFQEEENIMDNNEKENENENNYTEEFYHDNDNEKTDEEEKMNDILENASFFNRKILRNRLPLHKEFLKKKIE
jgi:hypothetical protein